MFKEILPGPSIRQNECHFFVERISSVNNEDNQYRCLLLGDLYYNR